MPIWTYRLQVWKFVSASNITKIQRFESKRLQAATNALYYIPDYALEKCVELSTLYRTRLTDNPDELVMDLLLRHPTTRLKRHDSLYLSQQQ